MEKDILIDFLESLASHRKRIVETAQNLRNQSCVSQALHSIDVKNEDETLKIESFLDVSLFNSVSLCLWLELRKSEKHWSIEGDILRDTDAGQDTVSGIDLKNFSSVRDASSSLSNITNELVKLLEAEIEKEAQSPSQ